MAGLYIHIPFCRSKCAYCDFFSLPLDGTLRKTPDVMEMYCTALLEEFELRRDEVDEPFHTIYIGGGTPTAIPNETLHDFIRKLLKQVSEKNSSYHDKTIREFTIEANPEDITPESIKALRMAGINRISIGIQSFDSSQLDSISRKHDASVSRSALDYLRQSGINYSADLIYGLPGQNIESWEQQLRQLLDYRPTHFSAYLLSYEPGTRLYVRRDKGIVTEADEETASVMYERLTAIASDAGYDHYEISNFALPGRIAQHNSSYWNLTPYVGLGCSAHSFDGDIRRVNPANLKSYISALSSDKKAPYIKEEENYINKVNDYIITSLRTKSGLSAQLVISKWGEDTFKAISLNTRPLIAIGRLSEDNFGNIVIPEKYWLSADAILREVILNPDEIF